MPKKNTQFNLPDELNVSMVTPKFRASYCHLVEPWAGEDGKDPRYSVQMVFDKDDDRVFIKKAKTLVKDIAQKAFGPNAVKLLRSGKLHNPFRDGDDEFPDDELYNNAVFVNANGVFGGKKPTPIYDRKRNDLRKDDNRRRDEALEDVVYSGCYGRTEIKFYPYDRDGGKGIACYLFRFQWMEHGDPLTGGKPVEDIFDDLEEEEVEEFSDDDDIF